MSNLLINPHYCPEDKDILDFIKSVTVSVPELVQYLRKRGVYVSKDASKEDLASLISAEVFAWEDVTELLGLLTTPLKKEHFVTGTHKSGADFELLEQAVKNVQTFRLNKYGDKVNLVSSGPGQYRVAIDYTHIDYEKTRLIQGVEREAEIVLKKTQDGFDTRRTSDSRAKEIELAILGEYEKLALEANHKLESSKIRLSQLTSIEDKVHFFTFLMEGLDGYAFEQIASVRVQSVKTADVTLDSEVDQLAKTYAASIESLIINGKNVSGTELYDKYVGKDFFPMAATWFIVSDTDECRRVEVRAAFVPDLTDFEMQFSVSAVWMFKADTLQPKAKPSTLLTARFAELLRSSAQRAVEKATTPAR